MARYLLDANLSPKIARALAESLGIEIIPLRELAPVSTPDHVVIQIAACSRRVIITQDRDFADRFFQERRPMSIIYLDLKTPNRTIAESLRLLSQFFATRASTIELDDVLVIITESETHVHTRPRRVEHPELF